MDVTVDERIKAERRAAVRDWAECYVAALGDALGVDDARVVPVQGSDAIWLRHAETGTTFTMSFQKNDDAERRAAKTRTWFAGNGRTMLDRSRDEPMPMVAGIDAAFWSPWATSDEFRETVARTMAVALPIGERPGTNARRRLHGKISFNPLIEVETRMQWDERPLRGRAGRLLMDFRTRMLTRLTTMNTSSVYIPGNQAPDTVLQSIPGMALSEVASFEIAGVDLLSCAHARCTAAENTGLDSLKIDVEADWLPFDEACALIDGTRERFRKAA